MSQIKLVLILSILVLLFAHCQEQATKKQQQKEITKVTSLKHTFENDFLIGGTLNKAQIKEEIPLAKALIPKEFNALTAENIMKWTNIHPKKDSFDFTIADQFVELGKKQDMFLVGHTLIWHSQLPDYVSEFKDKKAMEEQVATHINTIVERYKGKIDAWDVVNEALNEDGTMRETIFSELLGPDYLTYVFNLAKKTDPSAALYYNDYNIEQGKKRNGAVKMLKNLQEKGVKIDGVGIQGHWSLVGPPIDTIEKGILAFAELGLPVMITELDITVLPNPWDLKGADVNQNFAGSPFMNPYPESLPDSMQVKLAQRYEDIFALFLKHKDKISRVTFWGINDGQSWLNNWPIKDRTNYPLLFDRAFEPKKAYHRVMKLKASKQ